MNTGQRGGHGASVAADGSAEPATRAWRHRVAMLACCLPMLVLVVVLVVSGAGSSGALVFAFLCIGMMGVMMFAMPGGHRH